MAAGNRSRLPCTHLWLAAGGDRPAYYRQKYRPEFISLSQVQQQLGREEVWIEYFLADDFTLALIIKRDELRMVELATLEVLNPHISQFLKQLKQYDQTYDPKPAMALYQYLIASLELPKETKITLIPDGPLSLIPFEALLTQTPNAQATYAEWDFLLKSHQIGYAFSANSRLFTSATNRPGNGRILALAPMAVPGPDHGVTEALELPQSRLTVEYLK